MTCWRCHEPVQGAVCAGCGAISPPRPDLGLFQALGLHPAWRIDAAALTTAWRAVSRKVHPDRFASKSAVERRMSLQWTATINEARRVLLDPRMRAHYLATGQAEPAEDGGPKLDPDFLEAIFDLQMLAGQDPEAAGKAARQQLEDALQDLNLAMDAWEDSGPAGARDPAALAPVEPTLARIRYLDKTLAQIAGPR